MFNVYQVDEAGHETLAAGPLAQADAERFAAGRSLFRRECWGCVVRAAGDKDGWALVYKVGKLNDANILPVAVGVEMFQD